MSSSCIECVISLHDAEILQEGWCSFRSTRSRTCDRQHQVDRLNVASNRQLATFNVIELHSDRRRHDTFFSPESVVPMESVSLRLYSEASEYKRKDTDSIRTTESAENACTLMSKLLNIRQLLIFR